MSRLRRTRVLLACAGVVCALAVTEITLRLVARDGLALPVQGGTPVDAIETRANRSSRDAYGLFTYDENGFRVGSGLSYDRSILFIGDSFTEGRGVNDDETFARATERALRRDGLMVRSLNAGARGFGAAQELIALRRMLARFPIDAIVVQSFPMNDLSDNLADGAFGIENGHLVEFERPKVPLRARLASLVAQSWLQNLSIMRAVPNAMLTGDPAAPYDAPDSFDLERALLTEIVSTARVRAIPIVVLVVPTKLVQQVQRGVPAGSPGQVGEMQRFERVRALVSGFGVAWIDAGEIIPDLAADAASGDGGHFGKEGNTRIGEAIAERLVPLLGSRAGAADEPQARACEQGDCGG